MNDKPALCNADCSHYTSILFNATNNFIRKVNADHIISILCMQQYTIAAYYNYRNMHYLYIFALFIVIICVLILFVCIESMFMLFGYV